MTSPDSESSPDEEKTLPAQGDSSTDLRCNTRSPRRLGDYDLIDEIARGGMGIVYRAKQRSLNRIVAVKVIRRAEYASEQEIYRFRSEAEAAANLDHPNIVPIYEVGEHEGEPFFSMRLVEGESLADSLRSGRWPMDHKSTLRRAAKLMATVARAVHVAHQSGILHRDLKPGNILLDSADTPFITDFGLAKRVESPTHGHAVLELTQTGQIVGTPAFMSPEQAEGKQGLTTASDIYSLGTILYAMLARRTPFHAQSPLELLQQVVSKPAPPLREVNALVDIDLETICQKCLEKESNKRYSSALALAEDLERWLNGEAIVARPIGTFDRTVRWARRNPIVAMLLTSILILLTSIAALGIAFAIRLEQARFKAEQNAVSAQSSFENEVEARKRETEALSQTRRLLVHADLASARLYSDRGDHLKALHWIEKAWEDDRASPDFDALSDEDHRLRVGSELEKLPKLKGICFHDAPVVDADFSLDGRNAVTLLGDRYARVWAVDRGEQVYNPLEHDQVVTHAFYSPDGARIATIAGGVVYVWNAATGTREQKLTFLSNVHWLAFAQDSRRVLLASDRKIVGADCVTGRPDDLDIACETAADFIGLSQQADKFVATFLDSTARVFDAKTGTALSDALPQTRRAAEPLWETDEEQFEKRRHRPAFSPDGFQLLTCDDRNVYHWTQGGGIKTISIDDERNLQLEAFFTADGKDAVVYCRPLATIFVYNLATGEPDPYLPATPRQPACVRLAADRPIGALAITGGAIHFFSMPTRQFIGPALGFGKSITAMKFSKDGSRLMGASLDGTIRVWATPGSEPQLPYNFDCGQADRLQCNDMRFSPDGKHVVKPVDGGVRIELRSDHSELKTLSHRDATPLRFSPDGRWLLTSSPKDAIVWDVEKHTPVLTIPLADSAINELAWCGQSNRLALRFTPQIESARELVEVWDIASSQRLFGPKPVKRKASPHLAPLVLNREGTLLAVPEDSDKVHVYELINGKELYCSNENRSAWIFGLGYGPKSDTLGVATSDLTLRQYEGTNRIRARPQVQLSEYAPLAIGYSADERWLMTCTHMTRGADTLPFVNLYSSKDSKLLATLGPLTSSSEEDSIQPGVHTDIWLASQEKRVIVHQPIYGITAQWIIPRYSGPASELSNLAKLFTNLEMDSAGNIFAIDPDEWLNNPAPYQEAWLAWRDSR